MTLTLEVTERRKLASPLAITYKQSNGAFLKLAVTKQEAAEFSFLNKVELVHFFHAPQKDDQNFELSNLDDSRQMKKIGYTHLNLLHDARKITRSKIPSFE